MNMPTIRPATREDRDGLLQLWLEFLNEQAALDDRFTVAEDVAERWSNDYLLTVRAERRRLFVAEHDGKLIGFINAVRWAPPPVNKLASEVYVEEIYVRPDTRRKGVGSQLVEKAREWATKLNARRLRLGVLAQNTYGRAFWESEQGKPVSITYTIDLEGGRDEEEVIKPRSRLGF